MGFPWRLQRPQQKKKARFADSVALGPALRPVLKPDYRNRAANPGSYREATALFGLAQAHSGHKLLGQCRRLPLGGGQTLSLIHI